MADIELSFGVKGGVGGATSELQEQLSAIVDAVNKKPIELKVKLDETTLKRARAQITELANYAKARNAKIKNIQQLPTGQNSKTSGSSSASQSYNRSA